MPRTNLRRNLAGLCRAYTGECATAAGQRLALAVELFTPAEREVVVDVLRSGIAPHRYPIGNGRTDAARLGAALLPDASSPDQQAVEADLLRAVLC